MYKRQLPILRADRRRVDEEALLCQRARDVAEFVALGGSRPDLLYDFRHGFVDGPTLAAWEGGLQAKAPKPKAGRTFVI